MVALISAGVVFGAVLKQVIQEEPPPPFASQPSIVEIFASRAKTPGQVKETPPLVKQAEAFAVYLNRVQTSPPQPKSSRILAKPVSNPLRLPVSPPPVSPNFRVIATSYYEAQPERSMVLILESGGQDGGRRWVKEGTRIDRFAIQEIRQGYITCRQLDGKQVREMVVEHGSQRKILVRNKASLAQASEKSGEGELDFNLPLEAVP
jgi:hypothetical protein